MDSDEKSIDPEIRDVIAAEKRRGRSGATANERKKQRMAAKALDAIRARDERAFAMHLREADVREGSDEWKRAWRVFRQACGGS